MKTPFKISLDFYRRNIVVVNAKQLDDKSRHIEITCTENGKKFVLDSATTTAYIRYCKPDNTYIFRTVTITEDGIIDVVLNQDMLGLSGRCMADIMLLNVTDTVYESVEDILNAIKVDGSTTLSTMNFYVDIQATAIDHSEVASSHEFDALTEELEKLVSVENHMKDLENTMSENEAQRQQNEEIRIEAETKRQEDTEEAIQNCNTATENANTATTNANIATENANDSADNANKVTAELSEQSTTAINNCNIATESANEAAANANSAAELCKSVVDQTNVVLKDDIANNLTTEDEGMVLDATQGTLLLNKITELQEQINAVRNIYYGTEDPNVVEPNNGDTKDGDVYMLVLEDSSGTVGE